MTAVVDLPVAFGGTLGCGKWTLRALSRGGGTVLLEVDASSVETEPKLNDFAAATVTVAQADVPASCVGVLANLRPWAYEVELIRDGEVAFVGPISTRLSITRQTITFEARDLFQVFERRVLPRDRTFNDVDLSTIFETLASDALSSDPSVNVAVSRTPSGVIGDRSYLAREYLRAADKLRELSQVGVDFHMRGRTLVAASRTAGVNAGMLLDDHVTGEPTLNLDGQQTASQEIVLGSGTPPVSGRAGGTDPLIGLVQNVTNLSDVATHTDARRAAEEILVAAENEPLELTVDLAPSAPLAYGDLRPGNVVDVNLRMGYYAVREPLVISAAPVRAAPGSETITLTLVRPDVLRAAVESSEGGGTPAPPSV